MWEGHGGRTRGTGHTVSTVMEQRKMKCAQITLLLFSLRAQPRGCCCPGCVFPQATLF